jgi:hypothetical protein
MARDLAADLKPLRQSLKLAKPIGGLLRQPIVNACFANPFSTRAIFAQSGTSRNRSKGSRVPPGF